MAGFKLTSKQKLIGTIAISFSFFVAEIIVAFMTGSLALLADAFHYLNDLIGFVVALVAVIVRVAPLSSLKQTSNDISNSLAPSKVTENADSPSGFSFGWARASLLGAFFNGVFLLALGVSIFLQSIERFISLKKIEDPKLVLIMGCVGLALNVLSAALLHEHHGHHHNDSGHHVHPSHDLAASPPSDNEAGLPSTDTSGTLTVGFQSPLLLNVKQSSCIPHADHRHTLAANSLPLSASQRDLGMLGALTHVLGDALNNVGVIVAALVIWRATRYDARFYADPGVGLGIAVMILLSALPLVRSSGRILLESAPGGVDIPGIDSVHELHIWRLDQQKAIASAHVVVGADATVADFMRRARTVNECLHAYGIHSTTLQPEIAPATPASSTTTTLVSSSSPAPTIKPEQESGAVCCQIVCGKLCEGLKCCAGVE
ncbi:hypothetical protein PG985_005930 [Apiospora marii]|uniref:Cation efflux protein n=1 Tax=Apiospora marii TaxID=335849 RepID=A0ABR1SC51_9PEZI